MSERIYGRTIIREGKMKKRSTKKKDLAGAFALLMFTLCVGIVIGCLITHKLFRTPVVEEKDTTVQISEPEQLMAASDPYGSGDNRILDDEHQIDWSVGRDLGFVPLDVPLSEDLQEFTFCLCYIYDLDWTLIMAMMEQESDYKANLVSSTNDYGLMQINRANHDELREALGVTDFLDATQNIRCGVYMVRMLFDKYGDDTHRVLMSYNMGETGAKRLWDAGIRSTSYSKSVTEKQNKIKERRNKDD